MNDLKQTSEEFHYADSYKKKKNIVIAVLLLILILAVSSVVFFVVNKNPDKSPNTNLSVKTSTVPTITSIPTTSAPLTPLVSATPVNIPGFSIIDSEDKNPKNAALPEYGISLNYPQNWTLLKKTDEIECGLMGNENSSSLKNYSANCTSTDKTLPVATYKFISDDGRSTLELDSGSTERNHPCQSSSYINFYVYIKGTKYEFYTCHDGDTYGAIGTIESPVGTSITGDKSIWKTLYVKYDTENRQELEKVLDILWSIY